MWIETHQSLATHRKLYDLAGRLEVKEPVAIGHLVCLWLWALDNALDGHLVSSRYIIAKGAQWDGEANSFVQAIIDAGFIDVDDNGELWLHDWEDYAGKLLNRRESNRIAAEKCRAKRKITSVVMTSALRHDDVSITSVLRNDDVIKNHDLPDLTVPDLRLPLYSPHHQQKILNDDVDALALDVATGDTETLLGGDVIVETSVAPKQQNARNATKLGESGPRRPRAIPLPTLEESVAYAVKIGLSEIEGEKFFWYNDKNLWRRGDTPVGNWKSALNQWKLHATKYNNDGGMTSSNSGMTSSNSTKNVIPYIPQHQRKAGVNG